jgi:hypothetical protein
LRGTLNIGLVCIGCVLFFSGCQSLVTQQIETAESYPFNNQMVQQMKTEYGLEKNALVGKNISVTPIYMLLSNLHVST